LVRVEPAPMLVVNQGEVAVINGYVGLPTLDTSGQEFKFGSIVQPGHRGIWREALRTGKYPLNPRIYAAEKVPTIILTLNWAAAMEAISRYRAAYEVETRGVYIQDVAFPQELVAVLTRREIANQEKATFEQQKDAQTVRVDLEKARGTADMQAELAKAQVSVY